MTIEKVEGIVIRDQDYSESSKILTLITRKYGLIKVIAKGAKKPKNKLNSITMKFTYGFFYIYYKGEHLSTLISADIIDSLRNIKTNLVKISYITLLSDLTEQTLKQLRDNAEDIFSLYIEAIKKINEGYDEMVISHIIELKYLDFLGVKPVIDCCSKCGSLNDIITISSRDGGYLCKKCYSGGAIASQKTINYIRLYYYLDICKISKTNVDSQTKEEMEKFIREYYDHYTGIYLKSEKILKQLSQITG